MSIVNNIQGTLTQTQHAQQLQQQQGDQGRVQQNVGEHQSRTEQEERAKTVNAQEDVDLAELSDKDEEQQNQKQKKKKKTLSQQEETKQDPMNPGSIMMGGGLINTQA